MFQLKYLECQDFFSFDNASIRFTKGMVLISGYDEQGKDSNGCGKSTILNAICWALFGRTLKGVQGQDVVRWGCKNCKVVLILEGEGHTYEIQRSLDAIRFNIDASVVRGHHRDIQSAIETTFKTNYSLFIRSTAFSQSQVDFLAAAGDAEKKRLFKEILSLSRLDEAYVKIRDRYDLHLRRAERLEGELEALTLRSGNINNKIDETKNLKETWEEGIGQKVRALEARRAKVPRPTEELSNDISLLIQQVHPTDAITEDISQTEKELYEMGFEIIEWEKSITKLWELMERGATIGQRCELCGSVVKQKMLGAHKQELEVKISELKERIAELNQESGSIKERLSKLYRTRLEREELCRTIETKKRELAINVIEWEHYTTDCQNVNKQIEEIKNGINPYDNIHTAYVTELNNTNLQHDGVQKDFEDTKGLIDTLAFIKFTLSREGAVGHIIEREYSTLMSYANRLLSEISGGHLRLSINPQRELKSGALKEEIEIVVYSNEQKTTYWGLSDGQRSRVNVALLLALNKLCTQKQINAFDFLLLDEVVDLSLDEAGEEMVMNLLKNYLRECSLILLVSHKEKFKTSFNNNIKVYRDLGGVSHLDR
jgi:DNA repair exonuclease SbcCD ATPase subunit